MNAQLLKQFSCDEKVMDQILQDSLFMEERRSSGYIQLMTQVQRALDQVPADRVHVDLRDITSRRGSLIYLVIDGLEKEIPYDILYAPRLKHGIRNNLIQDLDTHKSRLSLTHRRLLSRLQRIHKLENLGDSRDFEVHSKTKLTLAEIERILKVARRAHGSRKMDVLMEALLIPGRTYFDLLSVLQCLEDKAHPRHREAIQWLGNSRYYGRVEAYEAAVEQAYRQLNQAVEKVYDQVEALTGVTFTRKLEHIEAESSWFGLAPVAEVNEDDSGEQRSLRRQLRHSRFQEIKRQWSMAWFQDREQKVMAWAGDDPLRRASGLSRLLFELQKKLVEAPNPRGSIQLAVENDYNLGLLSRLEYDDARAWIFENWKALIHYAGERVRQLEELRQKHARVVLPEALELDLKRIATINGKNVDLLEKNLNARFMEIDVTGLEDLLDDYILDEVSRPTHIRRLFGLLDRMEESLEAVSPGNVPFLRQMRLVYDIQEIFEEKLADLYQRQDEMERLKQEVERKLYKTYRTLDYFAGLDGSELDRCVSVATHHTYSSLANAIYKAIDMNHIEPLLTLALKQRDPDEVYLRLAYLLQELQAVPEAGILLHALESWKELGEEALTARAAFISRNEKKRLALLDRIRENLKERLGTSDRENRRVRFEVFGFSECLAEKVGAQLRLLGDELPRIASIEDGERIAEELQATEDRVIEAQALSRDDAHFARRVAQLDESGEIPPYMARQLNRDLMENYKDLERLMGETGRILKRAREHQIRFGLQRDVSYLNLTLNLDDLESLKREYGFLETLALEDLKRYCLSYRFAMDLMGDLLRKLETNDTDVCQEIKKQYTRRVRKHFMRLSPKKGRGRELTAVLKAAILCHDPHIFEAECRRLIYFLNFADPKQVRTKDTYRNYLTLFQLAEDGDVKVNRWLKSVIARLRGQLFSYSPPGYRANFEHNRRAFITDLDDAWAQLEWY